MVMHICRKEAIFAGFWLENIFDMNGQLSFDYISLLDEKVITFMNISMGVLVNNSTEVKNDPIFDFVGNLTDTDNDVWVVFIQISLQSYTSHDKKLDEMFKRNSGNNKNPSRSLYTKYRNN